VIFPSKTTAAASNPSDFLVNPPHGTQRPDSGPLPAKKSNIQSNKEVTHGIVVATTELWQRPLPA
jgi:hypothetical protein